MALDTGASFTLITPRVLRLAGVDGHSTRRRATVTTASRTNVAVPLITIPRIDALEHSVSNLDIVSLALPLGLQVDGLLGLNFLRYFKLYINFSKGILVIHERIERNFGHRILQLFELIKAYW